MTPKHLSLNLEREHLNKLLEDIGLAKNEIARSLDVSKRQFRAYFALQTSSTYRPMPYVIYYALSVWAAYCRYERKIANNSLSE